MSTAVQLVIEITKEKEMQWVRAILFLATTFVLIVLMMVLEATGHPIMALCVFIILALFWI